MNCAIYTVTSPSGACLYVGSTTNPKGREKAHKIRFPNAVFSIVKMVPAKKRGQFEKAEILKQKQGGHILENKNTPGDCPFQELLKRLKQLRIGSTLRIKTKTERETVLRIAKVLGLLIHTRPSKRGGFTVTRLPE
jgi:hypothetical protein